MTSNLDLPPTSSPDIDPYRNGNHDLMPFALYNLLELSDKEITTIENICNDDSGSDVRRAPNHDFHGQSLRAAWDDFLHFLVPTRSYDPIYFVVIIDDNWKEAGVLLVTLDVDGETELSSNDKLRVPVEMAGVCLANLQIANMAWEDYREEYGDGGNEGNDGDDHSNGEDEIKSITNADGRPQNDNDYSDDASSTLPGINYWIGLYAVEGINFETVMRKLDRKYGPPIPPDELICRPEGRVPIPQAAALAEATRLHPMRCRNNEHLHRGMFLITDSLNCTEDGLLLVQIRWDEKVEGRSLEELAAIGSSALTDTQRLPADDHQTLTIFNSIHAGYRPWKHQHKTFMAYGGPTVRYADRYLQALDKSFKGRKSGSERFLFDYHVQYSAENDVVDVEKVHEISIDQHEGFVRKEQFRSTLCPEYYVYCDQILSSKDQQAPITLVRVEGDKKWKTMECLAGNAYNILCEIIAGKREWGNSSVS